MKHMKTYFSYMIKVVFLLHRLRPWFDTPVSLIQNLKPLLKELVKFIILEWVTSKVTRIPDYENYILLQTRKILLPMFWNFLNDNRSEIISIFCKLLLTLLSFLAELKTGKKSKRYLKQCNISGFFIFYIFKYS